MVGVLNLKKNDVLDLTKTEPGLKNVMLAAGWDVAKKGFFKLGADYDLDLIAILLNENDKNEILKFCKNTRDKTLDKKTYDTNISIHHLYHEIRSEYSTFDFEIVPQDLLTFQFVACNQDNKRIKAQDGCFAIFGLDKDLSEKELEKCVECHLIIPAKAKINILKELEHLGINEKSIYPCLENSMLYLMSKKNNPNNIF